MRPLAPAALPDGTLRRNGSLLVRWTRAATAALVPSGLARRFARALVGLVAVALLANGAVNMWLSYKEAKVLIKFDAVPTLKPGSEKK